jgi:phage recombination protein Bet
MTNAIAPINGNAVAQWGMTRDQLDLLKRTVAEGTTDDEFSLFMNTSQRLGLDPFAKHIYAVKRPSYDRRTSSYVDKMTIQVGIDGFRAVADRTGENDGQDGPFWCGDDGVWKDAWLHDADPAAAKVVVYKKGCSKPFTGIATFRSYVQTTKDGKPNRQWQQMPDVMLAKCAEALALRKAFPSKLSGVYTPEEMGQADNSRAIDAEIVSETKPTTHPTILAIDDAPGLVELEALAPQLMKLPEAIKAEARSKYRARKQWLIQQEVRP